jgi:hypothetical protein
LNGASRRSSALAHALHGRRDGPPGSAGPINSCEASGSSSVTKIVRRSGSLGFYLKRGFAIRYQADTPAGTFYEMNKVPATGPRS